MKSIGNRAFEDCFGLTSVTIPNSVTSIGESAFWDCSGLTSITIPNSVTSIQKSTFYDCSGLTSVTIPNSVTSIGDAAFYNCSGLTSVTIPNSVTSIGEMAFYGCDLTSINIPNSVTSIGQQAFSGNYKIASVYINSIENWCNIQFGDEYANPLYRAHNLYLNGKNVTSLVIPETVEIVRNYAFIGCASLTDIWCMRENPPVAYGDTFGYSVYNNITLHVPAGCREKYKEAVVWSKFTKILVADVPPISKVCEKPVITFDKDNNKIIVSSATDGATVTTTVTSADGKTYTTNEIPLSGTFTITAIAKKNGYENSEAATETFTFPLTKEVEKIVEKEVIKEVPVEVIKEVIKEVPVEVIVEKEVIKEVPVEVIKEVEKEVEVFIYDDTHSDIVLPTGERVTIEIKEGIVTIKNLPVNSLVSVYTESGELWETRRVSSTTHTLDLPRHSVYIIKASGKTFKVKN